MKRVSVVGSPGSGKSSFAASLASRLGVPHIELDAIFHQAGWEPKPRDEFREEVGRLIRGPGWAVDGNYSHVRDLVWAEADTVVWLDLSKPRVMAAVARRTLGRIIRHEILWNGNRESLRNVVSRDPERNLLLWTWTQFEVYREAYSRASTDPSLDHLEFIRLRSRREVRDWLDSLVRHT